MVLVYESTAHPNLRNLSEFEKGKTVPLESLTFDNYFGKGGSDFCVSTKGSLR